jgi:DNA-binding response OmpR family regulator
MSRSLILVVDSDAGVRDLLRDALESAGHEVREAPDGPTGLRAVEVSSPDLVILDAEMPALDGWTTLERIRDLSDAPALMLTSLETEIEHARSPQASADDYILKPFDQHELLARVEALLRRPGPGAGS